MRRRGNGEGTYTTLKDGRIQYKKSLGRGRDGKRKYITVTGNSMADCNRKMNKKLAEIEALKNLPKEVMEGTLTDLCIRHLEEDVNCKYKLKPTSTDRREGTIMNQIAAYEIGKMQVKNITGKDVKTHIENLIRDSGLSVSSIKKVYDIINASFKWAVKEKMVLDNPCSAVGSNIRSRLKKVEEVEADDADVIVLSVEETDKLVAVKEIRNKNNGKVKFINIFYLLILLFTGMRVGELCALLWGDYDASQGTLRINKTRYVAKNRNDKKVKGYLPEEGKVKNLKGREIVLTEEAKAVLDELYILRNEPGKDEYICLNKYRKPSTPTKVEGCLSTIYRAAGLSENISGAHVLRRTCATRFYEEGSTIKDIAAYLGDTEATISKYYIAIRKRVVEGGKTKNVVPVPTKGRRRDSE